MTKQNEYINAEIPVANKHEAELAAKKAEELGYNGKYANYKEGKNYLNLLDNGDYFFSYIAGKIFPVIPLPDFLDQPRTETITLDNGEKWRVQLIEKVEEPMSAEEFCRTKHGVTNTIDWMERYAEYRLEFYKNQQQ